MDRDGCLGRRFREMNLNSLSYVTSEVEERK